VAELSGWSDGPALATRRDHHATAVLESSQGAFLYVMGGVQDMQTGLGSTEYSAIGSDGALGPFQSGAPLSEVMIGHSIAVVDDVVVLTAGIRAGPGGTGVLTTRTDVARVQADGTLSPWSAGPELAASRFHHSSAAHGRFVYVVGGLTGAGTDNTPSVERAEVSEDGTLSAWTEVTPLPGKRSHHAVVAHDGALWVTGGLSGDPAGAHTSFSDVLRAAVDENGDLGAWTIAGELPQTLATHSSFVHAGALYVAGGVEGGSTNTAAVRRAAISSDGTLGTFEELAPLPKARAHAHQTPLHAGFVYSAGGAFEHSSLADVFVGRFE
jgi:hypothetical protein